MSYIIVTSRDTGRKQCVPVSKIVGIAQHSNGNARIELEYVKYGIRKNKVTDIGVSTVESFEEVIAKLDSCIKK